MTAPRNAPAKQPKNTSGETGIGTREKTSATSAAQNGKRLRTAETMIGCVSLRPKL